MSGGVECGHGYRENRIKALLNGHIDRMVDSALFGYVVRMDVIRTEAYLMGIALVDCRQQFFKILNDTAFADEYGDTAAQSFSHHLGVRAFVVVADLQGGIQIHIFDCQDTAVAIDDSMVFLSIADFSEHVRLISDGFQIHDFS